MKPFRAVLTVTISMLVLVGACDRQDMRREHLEAQTNRGIRYIDVKKNPEAYRGQSMMLGGQVLAVERVQEGTRIELLQYSLTKPLLIPERRREFSHGRFVAMDRNGHLVDPAVLADNSLVTLVGEIVGATTVTIGEVEEQVPQLDITDITVWDHDLRPTYGYQAPYTWGFGAYYDRQLYNQMR
jgi:outer membrane lipoprotein